MTHRSPALSPDAARAGAALVEGAWPLLPDAPGVYRFRDPRRRVMYTGRATDLRSRVRSYAGPLRDRPHLRRMVAQIAEVEALECAGVHEATWLERNLLERSLSRFNRVRGGAEQPVWLVVGSGPESPGVSLLVERPASGQVFGPVLGSEKARAARSGLLRAYPLHLTGIAMSREQRSLAAARGVGPDDLARFASCVGDVLRGDPPALSLLEATLTSRRDRMSARLAYEAAAAITEELAAVRWVLAPQRVTGRGEHETTVHGTASGLLLRLTGHAGAIDEWRTTTVDRPRGERLAAASPPDLREWAATNAGLAARMVAAGITRSGRVPTPAIR